jgi:serine/threonine protein kinase
MLIPIIARYAERAERDVERYAAWAAALAALRADGPVPLRRLPAYLRGVPEDQRADAWSDLVAEHLRLAWRAGPGPRLEDYGAGGDLAEDEFIARHQMPHGDAPSLEEYERRWPRSVPALRARCLAGRYVLLRRIGRGAMAEVWEACDRPLRRAVAVKRPLALDEHALRRFDEEARGTARLEHPAIVGLHEYVERPSFAPEEAHPRVPFMVLRLVRGRTLGEARELSWDRRMQSFLAACDAVSYAHAQGVVHGDLKPGNILVGDFGETVVIDWGVVAGTPEYMAPEQADGRGDERSDVFGLGAVLFEMLAGRAPRPWGEFARPQDWRRVVREAPVPPPRAVAPAPGALVAVCRRATEHDAARRHASVAALAADARRASAARRRWWGI